MSVQTTADLMKKDAEDLSKDIKEKVKQFNELLLEMIDEDTWGGDDWSPSFRRSVEEVIQASTSYRITLSKLFKN